MCMCVRVCDTLHRALQLGIRRGQLGLQLSPQSGDVVQRRHLLELLREHALRPRQRLIVQGLHQGTHRLWQRVGLGG